MMLKRWIAGAALASLVAAPLLAQSRSDREAIAAAVPTGKPVSCIPIVPQRDSRVRSDQVIDFVGRAGQQSYRNTLPDPCPELGFERAFSYETSLSQLCSLDIITVFRNTGGPRRGASCGLGEFQPIDLPRKYR